ncbi:hypothetical protein T12_13430, partial [Trichinella patagoniensis]
SNCIRRKPDFFPATIILNVLGIHAFLLNSADPALSVETVEVASLSLITRKTFVQYKLWHHLISSSNLQCFRLNKSTLFAFNYSIRCHAIHRARGQLYFRSLTLMFRHINQIALCSHQMLKTNNYGFIQILEVSVMLKLYFSSAVTPHHFNLNCHIILCQSNRRGLDSHYNVPRKMQLLNQITSRPSSSVGFCIFLANLLVRVVISAFLNYGLRHPMNSILVPSLVSSRETTVPVRLDLTTQRVAQHPGALSWHQGIRNVASQTSSHFRIFIFNRYDVSVFKEYLLDLNSDRQCVNSVKPQAFPPGYAPGQIKICIFPQAMPKALYCTIFALRGPQALPSGYAPGQIKICIFPQAMPKALYCTIFALRGATPGGYASGKISKISNFIKYSPRLPPRLCPRANKNLHIPSSYAQSWSFYCLEPSLYTYLYSPP